MENEKKKRNKKKKNKQAKPNVPTGGVGELTFENNNNNHVNVTKQTVVDSDRESVSGVETSHSIEVDKSYWLNREASLEQKIKELQQQLEVHVQRENSAAETIASLNKDNARLQAQVIELEAFRNDVSHQNQQLKEHVSDLQSKIQDLENSVATHLSSERTKIEK